MRRISCLFVLCLSTGLLGFPQSSKNPPAEGFNAEGSDAKAIAIADQVMANMGGWKNWNDTRYITWKFFGRRFHVWDKHTGRIRVEDNNRTVLMNIHSKAGRAWEDGQEITDPDSLAPRLESAYRAWINDSYWLVMPYKLKDSGVTLKYMGEKTMENGQDADVLQLTFEEVGVTPENKYEVFVSKESGMVEQWSFFRNAQDPEPAFNSPWLEWKKYGEIMLSASRGNRGHSDLAVFNELPASIFESPEPVDLMSIAQAR